MPIYEYRCDDGHSFEVMQRMTDGPVSSCEECGSPVQRVFHPVAVHFKGSGFYNTDYGKQKTGAAKNDGDAAAKSGGDSSAKSGGDSTAKAGGDSTGKSGGDSTAKSGSKSDARSAGSGD